MDPLTILAAFGPIAVELGKAAIARWVAPSEFKAATIEQYATMREIDLKMFAAMNQAGGSNPSYPWVEAIVRLQRPAVGCIVLGTWAFCHLAGAPAGVELAAVDNFAGAVGFYLFGDRTLFYAKGRAAK